MNKTTKQDVINELEYYLAKMKILINKYKDIDDTPITSTRPTVVMNDNVCTSCEG